MSPKELPSRPRPLATSAAERIAVIIEATEKAAASVIDDAEEQASRYLDEARAEADRIVAERLRAVADELDPPASGARQAPHLKPVESPQPDEAPKSAAAQRSRNGSAGARLLATQMAVSGSSREEIEARLRSGFEIEDAAGILDAILGPED
ncbi:MAG TPA: hypothetical protein VNY83_01880 [Solirubrobacterales bacterium]|jgi:hypothetical protein|nr:hypothetical protein [Solirubrobacterales bacterium]